MIAYHSLQFAVFFLVVFVLYYTIPKKTQWWLLLVASVYFYWTASGALILWLLLSAGLVWIAGLGLERIAADGSAQIKAGKGILTKEEKTKIKEAIKCKKKAVLIATLLFVVGILLILKYANFFGGNISKVLQVAGISVAMPTFSFVLPLGISYYTLQAAGYLLDIYYNRYGAERNPIKIVLFLMYFPHIMQGPISKYNELSEHLFAPHKADYDQIMFGFQRVLWGCMKKLIIADRAAIFVNEVFGAYGKHGGLAIFIANLLYILQIYAEFSGCMDIIGGASQALGIPLVENFERPFFSKSVAEFWRRWHISLGRWLRDYVFYPLNMSKSLMRLGKKCRTALPGQLGKCFSLYIAMLVLWFVTGFWHGASWKYVVYGLYYGMIIIMGMQLEPTYQRIIEKLQINISCRGWKLWQMLRTFFAVFFGMLLFRAESLRTAGKMVLTMVTELQMSKLFDGSLLGLGINYADFIILGMGTLIMFLVSLLQEKGIRIRSFLADRAIWLRWLVYLTALFVLLVYGAYGHGYDASDFIYGQF